MFLRYTKMHVKKIVKLWALSNNSSNVVYLYHAVGSIVAILSSAVELPPALRRLFRANRMIPETTNTIQPRVQIHEAVFKNKFEIHLEVLTLQTFLTLWKPIKIIDFMYRGGRGGYSL